jgi:hypothetical protein
MRNKLVVAVLTVALCCATLMAIGNLWLATVTSDCNNGGGGGRRSTNGSGNNGLDFLRGDINVVKQQVRHVTDNVDSAQASAVASDSIASEHVTLPNRRNDYNFTVGLCVIVKDEEPYLMEWLDYQLLALEFDNVYIFDNSPNHDLEHWYVNSRTHPVYARVHVIHKPGVTNVQRFAYIHCVNGFGKQTHHEDDAAQVEVELTKEYGTPKHDYMAMLDVDEFIVLKQHVSLATMNATSLGPVQALSSSNTKQPPVDRIHDVIENVWRTPPHMAGRGCLIMNWMLVGSSHKTAYSPLPVLKRFQYRQDRIAHYMIKSMVYAPDFDQMLNPHALALKRNPKESAGTAAKVQTWTMAGTKAQLGESGAAMVSTQQNDALATSLANVALIYHVRYLSTKEYTWKRCDRKQSSGRIKGCDLTTDPNNPKLYLTSGEDPLHLPAHNYPIVGDIFDNAPWRFLTYKVPKYRIYDNTADWPDFHYTTPS